MVEGIAAIQKDFSRLEKWTDMNHMKFNNGKWKSLHLGWNNPMHQQRLGSSFAEKDQVSW